MLIRGGVPASHRVSGYALSSDMLAPVSQLVFSHTPAIGAESFLRVVVLMAGR